MNNKPLLLALLLPALALSGCGDDRPGSGPETVSPATGKDAVRPQMPETQAPVSPAVDDRVAVMASQTQPAHLVDPAGQALYMLQDNPDGTRCDAACEEVWPPVLIEGAEPLAGSGIDPALLGILARGDGSRQVTYDGKPLYRYAADAGAGRTAGHGVSDQWGEWALVSVHGPEKPQ